MKITKPVDNYLALLAKKKKLDEDIEIARNLMMDEMQKLGLKQIKTDEATVTIAKRVTKDVNEVAFRHWANEQSEFELDLYYVTSLDKKLVAGLGEKLLKEQGEIVPFVSARETEYISVREAK